MFSIWRRCASSSSTGDKFFDRMLSGHLGKRRGGEASLSLYGRVLPQALFLALLVSFNAPLQDLERLLRSAQPRDFESLSALLIVRDEELLNLVEQALADIIDRLLVFVSIGMDRDRQQPVVSFRSCRAVPAPP